jgi:hypothetical protein
MDLGASQALQVLHLPMVIYQSGLLATVFISHLFPLALSLIILTIAEEDASTEKEADDSLILFAIESWYLE